MFSNPEKNLLQFGISDGMHVADFGVGNGFYAILLSERVGESGKVFCIDVQNDLLHKLSVEAAEKALHNMEFIWSDIEKEKGSTLKKETIDTVLIANTLFQVEKKKEVAEEAHRILRSKGRVLLVEWADSFAGMGPHKDRVVKKEDAQSIFEKAGFTFDREIDAGEHHYGLIFRK